MSSMPHYLKKLFSRAYRRQLAAEERQNELQAQIQEHLATLPRCEGQILVATTENRDEGFFSGDGPGKSVVGLGKGRRRENGDSKRQCPSGEGGAANLARQFHLRHTQGESVAGGPFRPR
ncbi:hypothetical protein [Marinobacter nauticus]|uniref:hypothetical protein n=1 Tax=Marinobacter nauticus TaxID=2743 RepID=UPI001C94AC02|nr:hypothetical protein [Marinobacter nauticus]MBY6102383.1 hypothetical protein [Marinobacter nauticus]